MNLSSSIVGVTPYNKGTKTNLYNVLYSVNTQLYISTVILYIHTQVTLWQRVSAVNGHQANIEHF